MNATMAAISGMVPHRCMGIFSVMYRTCSSGMASTMAVRTTAGASALHVMPVSAYSLPTTFVSAMTAPLDAEYASMPALPSLPATDAMFTMRP